MIQRGDKVPSILNNDTTRGQSPVERFIGINEVTAAALFAAVIFKPASKAAERA